MSPAAREWIYSSHDLSLLDHVHRLDTAQSDAETVKHHSQIT